MTDKKKKPAVDSSRRNFLKQSASALAGYIIVPRFVLGGVSHNGSKYIPPSDLISLGFIGCGKQGKILSNYFLTTIERWLPVLQPLHSPCPLIKFSQQRLIIR